MSGKDTWKQLDEMPASLRGPKRSYPPHIQKMLDDSLARDRELGNDFWITPMTKEKLAPVTAEEWREAFRQRDAAMKELEKLK